jgi:phosphohistidine phosphatase
VRTLAVLRHAKSSWADSALPDWERPLAPRGRRDAKRLAKHLHRLAFEPELVLCSSAARARETLDQVRPAFSTPTVTFEARLYAASSDELLERLRLVPETVASVMLIGHNPGLQELVLRLAAAGDELERLKAKFPTGAFAQLVFSTTWGRLSAADAVLAGYVVPKQLR